MYLLHNIVYAGKKATVALSLLCVVFTAAAVSHAQVAETIVQVSVPETIEVLQWPMQEVIVDADPPGTDTWQQTLALQLRANVPWGVTMHSDSPTGGLRLYDLRENKYVDGTTPTSALLEWTSPHEADWRPLTETEVDLASGSQPTGAGGVDVTFQLRYTPSYNDMATPTADQVYRTYVTYTVGSRWD